MAINVYEDVGKTQVISTDGSMSNPLDTTHPIAGSTQIKPIYFEHTDIGFRYEFTLSCQDTSGSDESSWIQFAPDVDGVAGTFANTLDINLLANTVVKVYVRVTSTVQVDAVNKQDLKISFTPRKYAV